MSNETEMENLRETNMALVKALATAREDALKEAADACRDETVSWRTKGFVQEALGAVHCRQAILALSKQGKTGA